MKTEGEIIKKGVELTATINEVGRKTNLTAAQKLALDFARKLSSTSQTIISLTKNEAAIEAHVICRLLFEHFFNFAALMHHPQHRDILLKHSEEEPARQIKKIIQGNDKSPTLTPENARRADTYLNSPHRKSDTKTRMNWEQVASSGGVECLYTTYKQYSFLYAHSTLASLLKKVSLQDVAELHENIWTVLELARLVLRKNLLHVNDLG